MIHLRYLKSTIVDTYYLFKLLRFYIQHIYKIILSLLLTQISGSMKPIKSCVATGGRKFCNIYDVALMPAALSTISIKPAELKDLLRSCGDDDVYYYACGALNDSNKTCGALRRVRSLRS